MAEIAPHKWVSGEVITADKLNNAPFIFTVTATSSSGRATKTYQIATETSLTDVKEAYDSGRCVIARFDTGDEGQIHYIPIEVVTTISDSITISGTSLFSTADSNNPTLYILMLRIVDGQESAVVRVDYTSLNATT